MLNAPTCLHIPKLYEDSEFVLSWESVDCATGYRLECVFGEDFESASHGLTWANISAIGKTWDEIKAEGLTWENIRNLPTRGITWNDIMFSGLSWIQIAEKGFTWRDIQTLPARFIIYDGDEEKIPGMDMGLTWDDFKELSLTWGDISDKVLTWKEISFLLPKAVRGLSWDCFEARHLKWSDIAAQGLTWNEWKNQSDPKMHIAHHVKIPLYKKFVNYRVQAYNDMETSVYMDSGVIRVLPRSLAPYKPSCLHIPTLYREGDADIVWGELYGSSGYILERKMGSERDFKVIYNGSGVPVSDPADCAEITNQYYGPDCKRHFKFTDRMPIYESTVVYRIKGYNTTDESQYFVSDSVTLLPRSLVPYRLPCLHVPEFYEGNPANIVWSDLYDASGYVLERKLGGKEFAGVFDGPGEPIPHPSDCDKPNLLSHTPDCKQHLACIDKIPYYEKTAQYRIKGYNTTDSSQYLESGVITIIPVFYREDSISFSAVKGQKHIIQLCVRGIKSFENIETTLEYTSSVLTLDEFMCDIQSGQGKSCDSPVRSTKGYKDSGKLTFKCERSNSTNTKLTTVVAEVSFTATATSDASVRIY